MADGFADGGDAQGESGLNCRDSRLTLPALPSEARPIDAELNQSAAFHFGDVDRSPIGAAEAEVTWGVAQHVHFAKNLAGR